MKSRFSTIISTCLALTSFVAQPLHAEAYAPGTISFKPLNVNVTNYTFGLTGKDSRFRSTGFTYIPDFNVREVTFDRKINVFRSPASWGFNEGDRNGNSYGVELGYLFGMDWEIFGRVGFCRERGKGAFYAGDQLYTFRTRNDYGLSLGVRHYVDMDSNWKPFLAVAFGWVSQGKTKARVKAHSPFAAFPEQDTVVFGDYTLLKHQNLFTFELSAGTDYVFHPNWALSTYIAVRYNQRGGSQTTSYPAAFTEFNGIPFPLPPREMKYSDNKQRWYIPLVVSLKCML